MPRLPVIHRNLPQLILKGTSCRLDFWPVFLPALQVTLLSLTLFCITQAWENKLLKEDLCTTCVLLQASCSIRDL